MLGADRVRKIREFKKKTDPKGLLNPRKVIDPGILGAFMTIASAFEPIIRPFGNHVISKIGERFDKPAGDIPGDVTWHDSCHIGWVSGVYDPPREVIRAMPNVKFVEMEHNRENGHCCGSVLTLIKDPPIAAEIGKDRLDEAVEAGAQKVLALCPCCEFQLRVSADKKKAPLEIVDLARYASSARCRSAWAG